MKTKLLCIGLVLSSVTLLAQPTAVQKLFNKYAGQQGFTVVDINSSLFNLLKSSDEDNNELNKPGKLNHVKILVQEEYRDKQLNFYNEVMNNLPAEEYKELMVVKDSDQDMKILMKDDDDFIQEMLLVVGGEDDNVLIYISGNFNLEDLSELDDMVDVDVDLDIEDDVVENTVEL